MRQLATCFTGLAIVGLTARAHAQEQYEITGPRVAIYNLVGEVTVEPGRGSAVTVELTRGGADGSRLTIERGPIGNRATLRVIYPSDDIHYTTPFGHHNTELRVRDDGTFGDAGPDRRGFDWREGRRVRIGDRGAFDGRADLKILVPEGQEIEVYLAAGRLGATNVRGTVRLDAASADITTSGTSGALSVDVGSGNVTVRDAQGDVDVDTGSGDATVSAVTTGTLTIDTGSGEVDVTRVVARIVRLDTGSGSVRCELLSNPETLEVDTGSGSVTLTLPPSYGATVDIDSGSGGIDLDFPVQTRTVDRDHLTGTIGDGRGTLQVDTGSGHVRILRGPGTRG
jgi:hypothetical protein